MLQAWFKQRGYVWASSKAPGICGVLLRRGRKLGRTLSNGLIIERETEKYDHWQSGNEEDKPPGRNDEDALNKEEMETRNH